MKRLMGAPDKPHGPVKVVKLIFQESAMTDVVVGKQVPFTVQGFNAGGKQVPLTDATVTVSDPSLATGTVNADGTGGQLLGVAPGTVNVSGVAAGITSAPVAVNVLEDNTVVSVTITFGV
jgi:hypothetical protein